MGTTLTLMSALATPSPARTKVFVVEDHEMVATVFVELLTRSTEFEVVGTARDGAAAATQIALLRPDIVLLDLLMPGSGGLELMTVLQRERSAPKIVVCSGVDTDQAHEAAIALGALAFVAKSASVEELLETLRDVAANRVRLTPRMAESLRQLVRSRDTQKPLCAQDLAVLRQLATDHTPKEIAAATGLTVSGVYKIRRRICARTGASRGRDFRSAAARLGLIDTSESILSAPPSGALA